MIPRLINLIELIYLKTSNHIMKNNFQHGVSHLMEGSCEDCKINWFDRRSAIIFLMQQIIISTLYLLSILIPLTFTTITSELFEFPKFILLLSGTLVILVAWVIHALQTKDFSIIEKESPSHSKIIHLSVIAILLTQTIATIFSIHPYTSFWGYYSRFHQGLLTTICYTIIYFAAIKWMNTKSTLKLIKMTVGTSFLIGLYAIAEHFGIDKNYWVQDVQNRPFSTLGQPNWLAAFLIPNIFLTLYLSQIQKNKKSALLYAVSFVLFTALLFTKSRSGFIAFVLSFATYWLLAIKQFNFAKLKSTIITHSILFIVPVIIFGSPFTPKITSLLQRSTVAEQPTVVSSGTSLETGGTESGDIRKIVWEGAIKLIKKYPLIGTGPETFAYTYYWQRPLAHNLTSEWGFLYNKAHNEYLNIAAGSGIIGLLAYLYFHFAVFSNSLITIPRTKKIAQEKDDGLRALYPVLGATIVAFAVTNFFGFSVIPVYFLMMMIAIFPTTLQHDSPRPVLPIPIITYFILLITLIYPLRIFIADMDYAKGKRYLDANSVSTALPLLQKAVTARPGLDLYHATLGEAYSKVGQIDKALQEAAINKKLNPHHLNFYKSRAKIYLTLASIDPKYHVQAAEELSKARSLSPTDPNLAYNLGLVYTRLNDLDKAESQLRDAITLKPNYMEPYYALTLLYEQNKQTDLIPDLLIKAKANLATYSAQLKDKIEKYTD